MTYSIILSILSIMWAMNNQPMFWFSLNFLDYKSMMLMVLNLDFCLDCISCMFIFMVSTVFGLVCKFSQIYMDGYKIKKFVYILLSFFFIMSMLILSSSPLTLMSGWDLLGLVSLLLIFFYPNNSSKSNGMMTLFFNRMGDVLLMFFISLLIMKMELFYFILGNSGTSTGLTLMFIMCSLTKSAQFPLSSWLPAAMSAPTPISAMVHSSTLVTAGILIISKSLLYLNEVEMAMELLILISTLTMMFGGMMANSEHDFKKIIAFSTMSQISLIIMMFSMKMMKMGMIHMFFHALFKSSLFCWAGIYFGLMFGDQSKSSLSTKLYSILKTNMMLSIYAMSGLFFSSSFLSKHKVMEMSFYYQELDMFFYLIIGAFLTMSYCVSLSNKFLDSIQIIKMLLSKNLDIKYMMFYSMMLILTTKFFSKNVNEIPSSCEIICVFICLFLLFIPLCLSFTSLMSKFQMFSSTLYFMKNKAYSNLNKTLKWGGASFFGYVKYQMLAPMTKKSSHSNTYSDISTTVQMSSYITPSISLILLMLYM